MELAIVISIIAILSVGIISSFSVRTENANITAMNKRMSLIKEAIDLYALQHKRLPCPASLDTQEGSFVTYSGGNVSFGREMIADPSNVNNTECVTASGNGVFVENNVAYGMVPFKDLVISEYEVAKDPWLQRIAYAVDLRFTGDNVGSLAPGVKGFEFTQGSTSNIRVQDRNGNYLFTGVTNGEPAVYVLISHGENKLGGFNYASGIQFGKDEIGLREAFNVVEISGTPELNTISANPTFAMDTISGDYDDYVRAATRTQIIKKMDIEVRCPEISEDVTFQNLGGTSETINFTWPITEFSGGALIEASTGKCSAQNTAGSALNPGSSPTPLYAKPAGSNDYDAPARICKKDGTWGAIQHKCIATVCPYPLQKYFNGTSGNFECG